MRRREASVTGFAKRGMPGHGWGLVKNAPAVRHVCHRPEWTYVESAEPTAGRVRREDVADFHHIRNLLCGGLGKLVSAPCCVQSLPSGISQCCIRSMHGSRSRQEHWPCFTSASYIRNSARAIARHRQETGADRILGERASRGSRLAESRRSHHRRQPLTKLRKRCLAYGGD